MFGGARRSSTEPRSTQLAAFSRYAGSVSSARYAGDLGFISARVWITCSSHKAPGSSCRPREIGKHFTAGAPACHPDRRGGPPAACLAANRQVRREPGLLLGPL